MNLSALTANVCSRTAHFNKSAAPKFSGFFGGHATHTPPAAVAQADQLVMTPRMRRAIDLNRGLALMPEIGRLHAENPGQAVDITKLTGYEEDPMSDFQRAITALTQKDMVQPTAHSNIGNSYSERIGLQLLPAGKTHLEQLPAA